MHSRCNLVYSPPEPSSIHLAHLQTVRVNFRIYAIQETFKKHHLSATKTSQVNGFTSRYLHLPTYITWTQLTTEIIFQLQAQFNKSVAPELDYNNKVNMINDDLEAFEPTELHLADPVSVRKLQTWTPQSTLLPCLWGTLPTTTIQGSIGDLNHHIWISVYDTQLRLPPLPEPKQPSRGYSRSQPSSDLSFLPALTTRLRSSLPEIHRPPHDSTPSDHRPLPHALLGSILVTVVQLHGPPLTLHVDHFTHPLDALAQAEPLLNVPHLLHLVYSQQPPHQ